jgi:hypothetical protein
MTLLRRAPREVYRVYDEEEFFAGAGREQRPEVVTSVGGERRLHRVAGATMLLAITGAVGGLVAITSLSSAGSDGIRRGTAQNPDRRARRVRVARRAVVSRHARALRPARALRRAPAPRPARAPRAPSHAVAAAATAVIAAADQSAPIAVATPVNAARAAVGASARPQHAGQPAEFGFER